MPLLICSPLCRNDNLVIGRPGGVVGGRASVTCRFAARPWPPSIWLRGLSATDWWIR